MLNNIGTFQHNIKMALKQFGSPVNIAVTNAALSSGVLAGMELAGYPSITLFIENNIDSLQDLKNDYLKLMIGGATNTDASTSTFQRSYDMSHLYEIQSIQDGGINKIILDLKTDFFDKIGELFALNSSLNNDEDNNSEKNSYENLEKIDKNNFERLLDGNVLFNVADNLILSRGEGLVKNGGEGLVKNGGEGLVKNGGHGLNNLENKNNYNTIFYSHANATLIGTSHDDTLLGSISGGDTLIGLSGNDTYLILSDKTQIIENKNEGIDTAYIGVDNYITNAEIEKIAVYESKQYAGSNHTIDSALSNLETGWHINGNIYDQTIIGGSNSDVLTGGGGSDTLIGGMGDDVYHYTGTEQIVEQKNQGYDVVIADKNISLSDNVEAAIGSKDAQNINITGNSLNNILMVRSLNDSNTLIGGAGNDTLIGNGGEDYYQGGNGSDTFIINSDSNFQGEIADFKSGEDNITFVISKENQPSHVSIADSGLTGEKGQINFDQGLLQLDFNGDSVADVLLLVNEMPTSEDIHFIDPKDLPGF